MCARGPIIEGIEIRDRRKLQVGELYHCRLTEPGDTYCEFWSRFVGYKLPGGYDAIDDDYCEDPIYLFEHGIEISGREWRITARQPARR